MRKPSLAISIALASLIVHFVMVACGDSHVSFVDAQTPPTGGCGCLAQNSFSLTYDLGMGEQRPRAEFSESSISGGIRLVSNAPSLRLSVGIRFVDAAGGSYNFNCTFGAGPDGTNPTTTNDCSAAWPGASNGNATVTADGLTLTANQSQAEIRATTLRLTREGSTITLRSVRITSMDPTRNYSTPNTAYRP